MRGRAVCTNSSKSADVTELKVSCELAHQVVDDFSLDIEVSLGEKLLGDAGERQARRRSQRNFSERRIDFGAGLRSCIADRPSRCIGVGFERVVAERLVALHTSAKLSEVANNSRSVDVLHDHVFVQLRNHHSTAVLTLQCCTNFRLTATAHVAHPLVAVIVGAAVLIALIAAIDGALDRGRSLADTVSGSHRGVARLEDLLDLCDDLGAVLYFSSFDVLCAQFCELCIHGADVHWLDYLCDDWRF